MTSALLVVMLALTEANLGKPVDLTPLQRVADVLLREQGSDLTTFLRERSDLGVPATRIAAQLAEATGGEVDITDQAVRNWLRQFSDRAAA